MACGGKPDKTGFVRKETLVKIIKGDFGLTINIEVKPHHGRHAFLPALTSRFSTRQEMINKLDVDGSGEIEFDEFKAILT